MKHGLFLAVCILLGLFYGFTFVLFPPQLLVYLVLPIALLALLVVWALPDSDHAPVRLLGKLILTYFIVVSLWPNYLAIQLPGLPWFSFRRIVIIPLLLCLLIACSVSSKFRHEIGSVLGASKPLLYAIIAFTFIQFCVLFLSSQLAYSFNYTLNFWLSINSIFFASAWLFAKPGKLSQVSRWFIVIGILLCVIGALEARRQMVLWAGYIPSFLTVQDEVVARILSGTVRDDMYRVIGPFSVSLVMAEYLAFVTPFVIDRLMKARSVGWILIWAAVDLALLGVINLTQARLGVLGWIVAHSAYGLVWVYRRWYHKRHDIVAPAAGLSLPVGVLLFFIGMFTFPAIRNRTIGGGSTGLSDDARREQFHMLWPKLFRNPFGYGGGRSGDVLGYRQPGGLLTVDSYIISLLLDYGILGFLVFSLTLIMAVVFLLRIAWKHHDGELSLSLPLACTMLIVIQVRLVLSQGDNLPLIFMFLGMTAALVYRWKLVSSNSEPTT